METTKQFFIVKQYAVSKAKIRPTRGFFTLITTQVDLDLDRSSRSMSRTFEIKIILYLYKLPNDNIFPYRFQPSLQGPTGLTLQHYGILTFVFSLHFFSTVYRLHNRK